MKLEVLIETDADGDGHFQGMSTGKFRVPDDKAEAVALKALNGSEAQLTDTPEVPCRVIVKRFSDSGEELTSISNNATITADQSGVYNAHHYARQFLASEAIP